MKFFASLLALTCALASQAFAQCGAQWLSGLQTPDLNGVPISAVEWDPDGPGPRQSVVVFGGPFTKANSLAVSGVVAWDGSKWFRLEQPLQPFPGPPSKLLVVSGTLYALYNGSVYHWNNTQWVVDFGIEGVSNIVQFRGELIVFRTFSVHPSQNVARLHEGNWISIDPPLSSSTQTYNDAIEYEGKLFCAGRFQFAGSPFAPWTSFITFDGTNWADGGALPGASSGAAERLCIASNILYASQRGDIYARSGAAWITLPLHFGNLATTVMSPGPRGNLYLVSRTGSGPAVEWDTANWKYAGFPWLSLFGGSSPTMMLSSRFGLIAIGSFATRVSVFDGSSWSPLAESFGGMINAFGHFDGKLIAGHGFKGATSSNFLSAYVRIAQWNGLRFETVGSLPNNVDVPTFPSSAAIHSFTNDTSDLLVAGAFRLYNGSAAGGELTLSSTGQLQPTAPLLQFADPTYSVAVYSLLRFHGQLHAVGRFNSSGGHSLSNIALLGESGWEWPDAGLTPADTQSPATAAIVFNNELIVSGAFTAAGGVAAQNVARWDGENWHAMGSLPSGLYTFAIYNGELYGAGRFNVNANVYCLAKWTGTEWQFIPGPLQGTGYALLNYQGNLIIGGETTSGAIILHKWNGATLSEFSTGLKPSGKVYALAEDHNELVVGGDISLTVNGIQSNFLARWSPDGIPWIAQHPEPASANCGRSLTFTAAPALGYTKYTKYQWRRNGTNLTNGVSPSGSIISGATTLSLTLSNVTPSDSGNYDCVISSTTPTCPAVTTQSALAAVLCCPADFSGDLLVDDTDFQTFIIAYNTLECPPVCPADLNNDNVVDDSDFQIFVVAYNALVCE